MSVNSLLIVCLVALFSVALSVPVAKQEAPKEESKDMKTAESLYLRYYSPYSSGYALGDSYPFGYRSAAAFMPSFSSYQPIQSYRSYQPYYSGLNYDSFDYPWSPFYKK